MSVELTLSHQRDLVFCLIEIYRSLWEVDSAISITEPHKNNRLYNCTWKKRLNHILRSSVNVMNLYLLFRQDV